MQYGNAVIDPVYDIIEELYRTLQDNRGWADDLQGATRFEVELNKYFRRRGIGWKHRCIDGVRDDVAAQNGGRSPPRHDRDLADY